MLLMLLLLLLIFLLYHHPLPFRCGVNAYLALLSIIRESKLT